MRRSLALATLLLSGCGVAAASTGHHVATRTRRCTLRDVGLSLGPRVSPMTGEHAVMLVLRSRPGRSCVIEGYPAIRLLDGGRRLPFVYRRGGGPYVTGAKPRPVLLSRGRPGYILVAKYRCDQGDRYPVSTARIRLPGTRGWLSVVPAVGDLSYCEGTDADPGNRVTVSPAEPSFALTAGI